MDARKAARWLAVVVLSAVMPVGEADHEGGGIPTSTPPVDLLDGWSYEGETRPIAPAEFVSLPHGQGVLTGPEGQRYEGRFYGGAHYEGEVGEDGRPRGQGVMTWPVGVFERVAGRYEGEFRDGQPHGRGVLTEPDGTRLEGMFDHGYPFEGVLTFPDGRRYEGEFAGLLDGKPVPHGPGVLALPDGTRLEGRFHEGAHYEGEANEAGADGEPHGQGVLTLLDGRRYEGWFHFGAYYVGEVDERGRPHGRGVLTHRDGTRYEGEFRDGWPVGD